MPGESVGVLIDFFGFLELTMVVVKERDVSSHPIAGQTLRDLADFYSIVCFLPVLCVLFSSAFCPYLLLRQ